MKNIWKRYFAIAIAICMLLTSSAVTSTAGAYANNRSEDDTASGDVTIEEEATVDVASPAVNLSETTTAGVTVKISAPEGALPEGTTVKVTDVSEAAALDAASDAIDVAKESKAVAVDITFYDAGGQEIEPEKAVSVDIIPAETIEGDTFTLIHITDNGTATKVSGADVDAEGANFASNDFSIYAIISSGEEASIARVTYQFYVEGSMVYSQIVKVGDELYNPGLPEGDGEFLGWSLDQDGATGYMAFDGAESITVTAESIADVTDGGTTDAEVPVYAVFVDTKYVTFYDATGENILAIKKVQKGSDVTISDVNAISLDGSSTFFGWATTKDAEDTEYTTKITNVTADIDLYPVFGEAHWIYFDENDGGTGGGASYIAPVYVKAGEQTVAPSDPDRAGYTFGGWYTTADCNDGEEFTFGQTLEDDITIYAKWVPAQANYNIVIWKQKVTDDKNAADADKTYDYSESFTLQGLTGSTITVAQKYKSLSYTGFVYRTADSDVTIAANGSSVVNVYYDRILITIKFYYGENAKNLGNGIYGVTSWGNADYTFTGLYGQTFAEYGYEWPSSYEWHESYTRYSSGGPGGGGPGGGGPGGGGHDSSTYYYPTGTAQTLLTGFTIGYANDDATYSLYATKTTGTKYIYHYTENADSTDSTNRSNYTLAATAKGNENSTSFNVTNKFDGFTVCAYGSNSREFIATSAGESIEMDGNLYIYHKRTTYNIDFQNGAKGSAGTTGVAYGKSLSGIATPDVSNDYPGNTSESDNYTFVGWFADPECTMYVFFGEEDEAVKADLEYNWEVTQFTTYEEMPANDLVVYAGWFKNWYRVTLDVNGGTLPSGQAAAFWIEYGNTIGETSLMQATREDYTLVGWFLESENGTPWNFRVGVTSNVKLVAKWRSDQIYTVEYAAKDGSNAPTDAASYNDLASAMVQDVPTAPEGMVFAGWKLDNTLYVPGDVFTIHCEDADDDNVITLTAVYVNDPTAGEDGTTFVTYLANNGTEDSYTEEELTINGDYTILGIDDANMGYTYEGFEFAGWKDVNGNLYQPGDVVGVDRIAEEDSNILIAYWIEKLTVEVEGYEDTYDGVAHGVEATASDGEATILYSADQITWSKTPITQTDAADDATTIYVKATKEGCIDSDVVEATIQIHPKELQITTGGGTQTYNGQPLTCEEYTIRGLVVVDDAEETVTFATTGTITEIGVADNTYEMTWDGTAKQSNYTIAEENLGILEVTAIPAGQMIIRIDDLSEVYDGNAHSLEAATVTVYYDAQLSEEAAEAVQAATTISYSVNNQIWVTDVTELGRVDAGTDVIYVKAENPYCADAATTKAYLEVTAKPITITANDQSRAYGVSNEDGLSIGTTVANAAEVTIDGLVNETDAMKMIVQLTVSDRMYPADKAVGEYERAIAVSALLDASIRENYTVTYVPGTLTITNGEPDEDEINVQGYEGIYDADYHTVSVEAPEGATVYYSTDGENWTEDANDVAQKDVHYGVDMVEPVAYTVYYKVVQENYNDITGETGIFIYPASVDVYAVDAEKDYGTDDPELTYNVEGLLGDDTLDCIKVTVEREAGEDPGYYQINVSGEALQGNYSVGYEPAVFTIHEVEEETYTLTIHYVDQNGNPVAAEYVGTYNAGDAFNITSPTVEGYTPEYGYVQSGENGMPARDVEITIVYTQVIPGAEENIPVAEDDTTTPPQNPTDDDADATDDTTRDTTTTGTGGATTATAGNAATATQETIVDESTPGGATLDVDEDGEVTLVPEEDTALAAGLGEGFMFNGLYFVFLLIAALVYLFYTDNMKKHQVKIQEMIKERDNK